MLGGVSSQVLVGREFSEALLRLPGPRVRTHGERAGSSFQPLKTTLCSALSTHHPLAAEQGDRTLLLFPGAGRSVRGQGAGDATELGIWKKGGSLPAALVAAVVAAAKAAVAAAAAVEIVPALCRPHLSYLIHHYRIPPNRRAHQHFAT